MWSFWPAKRILWSELFAHEFETIFDTRLDFNWDWWDVSQLSAVSSQDLVHIRDGESTLEQLSSCSAGVKLGWTDAKRRSLIYENPTRGRRGWKVRGVWFIYSAMSTEKIFQRYCGVKSCEYNWALLHRARHAITGKFRKVKNAERARDEIYGGGCEIRQIFHGASENSAKESLKCESSQAGVGGEGGGGQPQAARAFNKAISADFNPQYHTLCCS